MTTAPQAVKAFDEKTQKAFASAFDAMEEWRQEISKATKVHSENVFDKLGEAARRAGWSDELIQSTKAQLLQASKLHADMIERITSTWHEQIKSATGASEHAKQVVEKSADFASMVMAPTQLWLQNLEMWHKNWTEAMNSLTGGASRDGGTDLTNKK